MSEESYSEADIVYLLYFSNHDNVHAYSRAWLMGWEKERESARPSWPWQIAKVKFYNPAKNSGCRE